MSDSNHATKGNHPQHDKGKEMIGDNTNSTGQMGGEDTNLEFSQDEEALIARMFRLVGQRWSLIAGRIPGRSAEEIEKYWTSKRASPSDQSPSSRITAS